VGSGFRTFTAGEVLTASNVQNYLMDQSVMVFGGSAARSSAIGTANFEEGMVSYLTDTDKVEAYNGTDWVSVAPTTSQGLTLINTTSFSGVTSQSFNSVFSATYDNYKILFTKASIATASAIRFRLRASGTDNSTASSYVRRGYGSDVPSGLYNQTESTTSWYCFSASTSTTAQSFQTIELYNPFIATETQMTSTQLEKNGNTGSMQIAFHDQTVSYDGFTVFSTAGHNIAGTISIFGFNK
jgi:hypothetical protein